MLLPSWQLISPVPWTLERPSYSSAWVSWTVEVWTCDSGCLAPLSWSLFVWRTGPPIPGLTAKIQMLDSNCCEMAWSSDRGLLSDVAFLKVSKPFVQLNFKTTKCFRGTHNGWWQVPHTDFVCSQPLLSFKSGGLGGWISGSSEQGCCYWPWFYWGEGCFTGSLGNVFNLLCSTFRRRDICSFRILSIIAKIRNPNKMTLKPSLSILRIWI